MKKRIVLKISGDFFIGRQALDFNKVKLIAAEIKILVTKGYKVGVVVGAGNIFRGRNIKDPGVNRVEADYIGMLGSFANGLALKIILESLKVKVRLDSTLNIPQVGYFHNPTEARRAYDTGIVIIFGGTSLPYFSTDTAAVLLALEVGADSLLKGTKVKGVYDKDPKKYKKAVKIDSLTYTEALDKKIVVMDQTAFALAGQHGLPIEVFKWQKGVALKIVNNKTGGSLVTV